MFRTRSLALLVAVSAFAAGAQELDVAGFRPVTVSAEVERTEAPAIPEAPDAGLPIMELLPEVLDAGVPPAEPAPTESKCTTTDDCATGFVCSSARYRDRFCQALQRIEPARGASADRFKYSGTVPRGFHLVSEPWVTMTYAGLGVFAAAYLGLVVAALAENRGSFEARSLIPFAGPVFLVRPHSSLGTFSSLYSDLAPVAAAFGLALDAIAQVAGVVMAVVGLALPKHWLERGEAEDLRFTFVPGAPGASMGASLVGRF